MIQAGVNRSDILPTCGACSESNVMLVDFAVTWTSYSGIETAPVWHCGGCNRLYSERKYVVESFLSRNVADGVDTSELQQRISEVVEKHLTHGSSGSLASAISRQPEIELKIRREIETSQWALREELVQLQRRQEDALHDIKARVLQFKLE